VAVHAANWDGQSRTADSGDGSAEWPALYSQYLTRTANQSARTLELFQEVMDRVSRNELPPTILQDTLTSFVQARGTTYTNQLTEISMRFFAAMVQISTTYSDELADLVIPGITVSPLQPPQFDTADPSKWFQQLNDYASQLTARAVTAYQSLLERVAGGAVSPTQFQEISSNYVERRLPEHLRRLGILYFGVLNGLNELRANLEEEFLTGILASVRQPDQEAPFVLNLIAPLGETATALMSLANTEDEIALIRCTVDDIRRADGVGPAFIPKITVAPDEIRLRPGDEASINISLRLDEGVYIPNAMYVGSLQIIGHGETSLEVPLRIKATPTQNGTS